MVIICMDKISASGLVQDNGKIGNITASSPAKGKRGRKGSQVVASKTYPLRSAHSSARVLRSTSKNKNRIPDEPATPLRSPHRSARVLQSTSKNKSKTPNEPVNILGSTHSSTRVLRSTSKKTAKTPIEPVNDNTTFQPAARKRKRGRPSNAASPKNDHIKIRQRVRYILNRMNYEQSLIQAYASEGWKGQSLEKIRPEKELQRAKAEILRCKLRIREAFQNMDSLLSEGKLEESLFDSEGEISSEDIFCAICGSKHVTLRNDIILCDGACVRGFHQKCLNPPLLAQDIPPGDEGWLCPACDCKLDCIDVLNELQGSTLSIHDSWEKVFPESALLANGSNQIGSSDLPSDDSEDNDYSPALAEGQMVDENKSSAEDEDEVSDSDDSDFMTSSDASELSMKKRSESKNKKTVDDLGLPSEDSGDDDFDPAGPVSSEDQKAKTNSEESDFTSDSDDFCAEIAKSCGQDEVSPPSSSDHADGIEISAVDNQLGQEDNNRIIMETELDQDVVLPVSSRRQVERLDYKRLYDEAYGKEMSDSSDDEEWSGDGTSSNGNLDDSGTDSLAGSLQFAKIHSRRPQAGHQNNKHTPQTGRCSVSTGQCSEVLYSNGSSSTSHKKHFGPIINQKLKVHLEKDPYPSRPTKESLAQELGLTFNQVSRWFSSARHYSRIAGAKKEKHPENYTAENDRTAADIQQREPNGKVLEKQSVDRIDNVSEGRVAAQNNIDEGKKGDAPFKQDISCEQTVVVIPTVVNQNCTTNSRKVGSPNSVPGENQHSGTSRKAEHTPLKQNTGCKQTVVVSPVDNQNCTASTSNVGSPKSVPGGNKRRDASRNIGSPRAGSAGNKIPGLEHVDEARRKAILRELRKMKAGR